MRNFRLVVAYDGTDFHGWQMQPNALTVQGLLMQTLEDILGETVQLYGSGRTDAGAHALAQVANFKTDSKLPCENLGKALNDRLPPSVRIRKSDEVSPDFHARYHVLQKTYQYRIWRGKLCPPFLWRYVYHHSYPLDLETMRRAAKFLEGEFDFTSFAGSEGQTKQSEAQANRREHSLIRRIFVSRLIIRPSSSVLIYQVTGSGFLHHMVRNIVGTLLEVGRGRMTAEDIPQILAARERPRAGPTVPAKGLVLVRVDY